MEKKGVKSSDESCFPPCSAGIQRSLIWRVCVFPWDDSATWVFVQSDDCLQKYADLLITADVVPPVPSPDGAGPTQRLLEITQGFTHRVATSCHLLFIYFFYIKGFSSSD